MGDQQAAAPIGPDDAEVEDEVWGEIRRLGVADHDIAFLKRVVREAVEAKAQPRPPTPKNVRKAIKAAKKSAQTLADAIADMGESGRNSVYWHLAFQNIETQSGVFRKVGNLLEIRERLIMLMPVLNKAVDEGGFEGQDGSSNENRKGRQPGQWQDRALMAIRLVLVGPPWSERPPHGSIERLARAIDTVFGPDMFEDARNQAERALRLHETFDLIVLRALYRSNAMENGEEVSD